MDKKNLETIVLQPTAWPSERSVATLEMEGTHGTVFAYNEAKRIKYRLVQGYDRDRLVLMQKLQIGPRKL